MSFFNIDENNISTDEPLKYIYTGISVNRRDIKDHNNDENLNSIKKQNVPDTEGKLIPIKNNFYQISLRNQILYMQDYHLHPIQLNQFTYLVYYIVIFQE
jgi:hypothetical protein